MKSTQEVICTRPDYEYLSRSMVRLSGIPVRVFQGQTLLCAFYPAPLPKDPLELYQKEIFSIQSHVGYYTSPLFHCYGVLNAAGIRFVLGPTSQIMASDQQLRELAFRLDVPKEEAGAFVDGMRAILPLPAERLLQMLCTMNHLLNDGETLELSDVTIVDDEQKLIKTRVEQRRTAKNYDAVSPVRQAHNTLEIEALLLGIVSKGDTVALQRWLAQAPPVQGGKIAGDQLRQMRNLFIVTATLVSRAAIRGGMREDDAFSLSDAYIQRVELLTGYGQIMNLQYNMILEFTEQVDQLHRGRHRSKLALDVAKYVRQHLSEPVSVDRMAAEFFLSRPYLSARFKQETGQTLTDFILSEKTEEAKRLLRYSDKSQSAISAFLGFSSQGHFAKVFKKYAGMTPGEYKAKHSA